MLALLYFTSVKGIFQSIQLASFNLWLMTVGYSSDMSNIYRVKTMPYPGTNYKELYPQARTYYISLIDNSKRRPYIRSQYFSKQKVFIELFWVHLSQKNTSERRRRIKFIACGIELLRLSRVSPTLKQNVDRKQELLYRFTGITPSGQIFYIQVKENTRTKRKDLISIFPAN